MAKGNIISTFGTPSGLDIVLLDLDDELRALDFSNKMINGLFHPKLVQPSNGLFARLFYSVAVHFSKQHFLDAALDISIVRKLGAPRFESGAAG